MSNVTIAGGTSNLPVANSIDGAADYLPIYTASATATQAINRNTLLGVSGTPADISSSQIFTNKVIGNTNSATLKDGSFTLQNTADTTKQVKFSLSGITTGTTRTYTLPDATDTLAGIAATQTLTNKTLTSPTINSPTITNATISADALTGYTVSNNGTVYGIAVTGGQITSSSSLANGLVTSTQIATNGVAASNLATSAIKLGYTQITSSQTTVSTTFAPVPGLTSTVTIPSGGRDVKITIGVSGVQINAASAAWAIAVYKDGSFFYQWFRNETTTGYNFPLTMICRDSAPSAGSHTYAVYFASDNAAHTLTIGAGAGSSSPFSPSPAFILVEAI